jgi:hypothetical protein
VSDAGDSTHLFRAPPPALDCCIRLRRSTLTLRAAATLLLDVPPVLVEQRVWGSRGYGLLLHLSS